MTLPSLSFISVLSKDHDFLTISASAVCISPVQSCHFFLKMMMRCVLMPGRIWWVMEVSEWSQTSQKKAIYSWELRFPFTTIWLAETTDDLMPLNPAVTFQFTFSWPLSSTWPHWCLPPVRTLQDATLSWTASSVFGWGFLLFAASFFFFLPTLKH